MKTKVLPQSFIEKIAPADRKALGQKTVAERNAGISVKWEREIHKQIQNDLHRRGIFAVHSRCDKRTTQQKGVPDFLMALWDAEKGCARPVAIEVKMPGESLTDDQEYVCGKMNSNGWDYYIVFSFEHYCAVLAKYDVV